MMTKKPQMTDLQQEDHHHPRAHGSMMLAAKDKVEKETGEERQTASVSCVAKKFHLKAHCPNRWYVPKTQ